MLRMATLAQMDSNSECRRTKQMYGLTAGAAAHESILAGRAALEVRRAAIKTLFEQEQRVYEGEFARMGLAFYKERI